MTTPVAAQAPPKVVDAVAPVASSEYETVATSETPALIVYVIDVSASMNEVLPSGGGKAKIALVQDAIQRSLRVMMRRSMKGEVISERYGIVLLTYSEDVTNVYGGVTSIAEALKKPLPQLLTRTRTNTTLAFSEALRILKANLRHVANCPAPMVCHLTDGLRNEGGNARQIVDDIRALRNRDGNFLVENIFVGDQLTHTPVGDIRQWPGVLNPADLVNDYLRELYEYSSPLPASYARELTNYGYNLQPGVKMLIPAESPDLVELAFAMAGATKTR